MNNKILVVIPIAGKSTRFKKDGFSTHKAFLDINSKFILLEIIDRFPKEEFTPCVVCTKNQFYEYKSYFEILLSFYPDLLIKEIEDHDIGPTYSVRQLKIEENIPVLVHYCDFLVDMNFLELAKNIRKGLICAPYFSGFHPASLGSTKFAYMKLNPNKYMITLKEKSSFTNNRIQEPCSTGIYAFPSFKIFKILADQLLASPDSWGQSESYTSLCLNVAIENGYKVFCQEVRKFICLGTPRDYKEYKYWEYVLKSYYANNKKENTYKHHIITAAGEGSRFKNYGYRNPKIFLDFEVKLLIEHAISSIKSEKKTIVTLKSHRKKIKKLKQDNSLNICFLSETPNGQLYTLFEYLRSNKIQENFFVSSADYKFNLSDKNFENLIKNKDPDIIILTTSWNEFAFENPENYGFISSTKSDKVEKIIEKPKYKLKDNLLSSLLIGTFWFKSSKIINSLISQNHSKDELFIAKTIGNNLSDYKVYELNVNYWLSLGTPKELHLSEYWFDFFKNNYN